MKKITYFLDIIDLMFTLLAYVKSLPHHQSYKAHRACNRAMPCVFSIFPALHFSINLLRPSTEQPTILTTSRSMMTQIVLGCDKICQHHSGKE